MAVEFVFSSLDTIGANAAEDDQGFLSECFVAMPELPVLQDVGDPRFLIIGRTGAGKTALFMRLAEETNNCHLIDADAKGFCYTERSTVLTDLADSGINLAPYLKLLWMHVLNIEIIQKVFSVDQKESLITKLKSLFVRKNVKEETAIRYLEEHQSEFWTDTTEKTKKISEWFTQTFKTLKECETSAEIGFKEIAAIGNSSMAGDSASTSHLVHVEQEKEKRWVEIISHDLASKIGTIPTVIDTLLENKSRIIYIAIDRIDESVISDVFRYQSLRGLVDAIQQLNRDVRNLKIVLSIRTDLLDCILKKVKIPGQQYEKYRSLFLQLRWNQQRLMELAEKRIQKLVRKRYQPKSTVSFQEFFPEKIHLANNQIVPFEEYLLQRTWDRPRDVIDFINFCIKQAEGKSNVTKEMIFKAERRYSQDKYLSLQDEWEKTIPEIRILFGILMGFDVNFSVTDIGDEKVFDWITSVQKECDPSDYLYCLALECEKDLNKCTVFRNACLQRLYTVGIIGIKFSPSDTWKWSYKEDHTYEKDEIQESSLIKIHPGLWMYYGIHE